MGDINIVERFHQEHGTPDWLKYQSEGKKGEGFNQWLRRIVLQDDPESSIKLYHFLCFEEWFGV